LPRYRCRGRSRGRAERLTDAERRTLEACSTVTIVTIPGSVFFLPNEVPDQIAAVVTKAVAAVNA
jgi:hypothetical protein